MSFSISIIGKPEAVKRKLAEHSANLSDQSKAEFDAARPALEILLEQNVNNGVVLLNASGHAALRDGVKIFGNCTVELKVLGEIAE